ncbi:MAG TPA: ATP-binding protein [Vicinamibacterales bacterium]|nr:ATP-binding protein [Vicinamibacterales bacterium]
MDVHGIVANRVLQLMSAEAQAELGPLATVQLRPREVLHEAGMPALYVYFPQTAVVSLVSTMEGGDSAEVALIGREGMVGLSGILGTLESPTSAVVQIGGTALRAQCAAVRRARATHVGVRDALDCYTEVRLIQMAQAAACNRLHSVEARLARSLLAVHQRIDSDAFVLSQEFMADMLGVHRPTVSVAFQRLQDCGAMTRRGRTLIVLDVEALEALACECHAVLDRELERLLSTGARRGSKVATLATAAYRTPRPDAAAGLEAMREIAGRLLITSLREQQAREEAEKARRSIDEFLATVSHELRTPLNAIMGWCALLKTHQGPGNERGLEVIERNAHAQIRIVEDLLDAARLTAGTLSVKPGRVDLGGLARETVDAVRPSADDKGVTVQLRVTDNLPPVPGDVDRLRQVLLNVLTNALKFSEAGGSVDVSVGAVAGHAQVIVRDTGQGIAPDVLPHVFERFHGSAGTRHNGLGLGLTIARALVERHGGRIEIDSRGENTGTTCTIVLPLVAAAVDSAGRAAPIES